MMSAIGKFSVLAACCVVAGCGEPNCLIEDVVSARMQEQDFVDCGNLATFEEASYRAAHTCVADVYAADMPFAVIWSRPSSDSRMASAYLGVLVSGTLQVEELWYDSDPGGESGAVTFINSCSGLVDRGECEVPTLNTGLCFSCSGQQLLSECRE